MTPAQRLAALRAALADQGVDGFLVPRADEYLGEYVPPSGERLAWLTGFTGSAGLAIVLPGAAALFVDGRYTVQAAQQADARLWQQRHITDEPPVAWLAENAQDLRIGYDPWLHSEGFLQRLASPGITLVPLRSNPLDAVWADQPAPPMAQAVAQPLKWTGESAEEKRMRLAADLRAKGREAVVLADPHAVAWLLNLRGADLEYTPLALGFGILGQDGSVQLFMPPEKVPAALRAELGNAVSVAGREALPEALAGFAGKSVQVDMETTPAWFAATLREKGAEVVAGEDPARLPRACKNPVEQQGSRDAHRRDATALIRFLAWFAAEAPKGGLTEMGAAEKLLALRQEQPLFWAESFPAIAGAGEHGAIVHYRATVESNRAINPDEVFLLDSGAQYHDGTTDVTRTLWTGPGQPDAVVRERYTRVLQGHIALATLRFPRGLCGPHLDAVARRPLWLAGLDYDHGTGHGIGSFLSVHEGPVAFSRAARMVPIQPGMILSDEPGYYLAGAYGIRIENLLLVRSAAEQADQQKPFLEFETLTLAPYDRHLILCELLTEDERAWVNAYHARVLAECGTGLDAATLAWLRAACAPLVAGL